MDDEKLKKIKEYLKLRKNEQEETSEKIIQKIYKEIINNKCNGESKND